MDEEREIARLWRVNRTIHELVRDRGYIISDHEIELPLDSFKTEVYNGGAIDRSKCNFYAEHSADPEQKIYVFYADERNVGVKTMRNFIHALEGYQIQRGIIIWSEKMTASARKVIEAMRMQFALEDFQETSLLVNITKHHLVPQHEVMSDEEKKALLARYRLKETQLPRILLDDPVARYYGLKRGQVVRITRPSETSGRYCSYRICM